MNRIFLLFYNYQPIKTKKLKHLKALFFLLAETVKVITPKLINRVAIAIDVQKVHEYVNDKPIVPQLDHH